MRKVFGFAIIIAIVGMAFVGCKNAADNNGGSGGGGSGGNTIIEIRTPSDLVAIATKSNEATPESFSGKTIKLMNDIDMAGQIFNGISTGGGNKMFSGTFDGNNKKIINLSINLSSTYNVGLIGNASVTSIVKNLGMEGSNITGGNFVGGIVGENYGTIINCYNTGIVKSNAYCAGGIAGSNNGTISNCYNLGSISGVVNSYHVGGIVGFLESGTVSNSYNSGTIYSHYCAGGIAGSFAKGTISNCYNTGNITALAWYAGGIIGNVPTSDNTPSITNCYNIGTTTANSGNFGGITGGGQNTKTVISSCYSLNKITSMASYVGTDNAQWSNTGMNEKTQTDYKNWTFGTAIGQWELRSGLMTINGVIKRPLLKGIGEGI